MLQQLQNASDEHKQAGFHISVNTEKVLSGNQMTTELRMTMRKYTQKN